MRPGHPWAEYAGTPTLKGAISELDKTVALRAFGSTRLLDAKDKPGLDIVIGLSVAVGSAQELRDEPERYQGNETVTYAREMKSIVEIVEKSISCIRSGGISHAIDYLEDRLNEYRRSPGYEERLDERAWSQGARRKNMENYGFSVVVDKGLTTRELYGREKLNGKQRFRRLYNLVYGEVQQPRSLTGEVILDSEERLIQFWKDIGGVVRACLETEGFDYQRSALPSDRQGAEEETQRRLYDSDIILTRAIGEYCGGIPSIPDNDPDEVA
jgi:hypothetical protein